MNHLPMTDDELGTAVRESVAGVHMTIPAERIMSRGAAIRARRRMPVVAGALAGVAGVALAVAALLPSGHQPGTVQLTAWTVASQANGDIQVTIRELRDPAGLQSTLRADGVPVNVSFSGPPLGASCQPYPGTKSELGRVVQFQPGDKSAVLVIDPSAIPAGGGLLIFDRPTVQLPPQAKAPFPLAVGLVLASQQCTGS
jgi:hypothetical protein